MASKVVKYGSHHYTHTWKPGPKPLPVGMLDKRVNISLSPPSHAKGRKIAKDANMSFLAWVEMQIWIHTESV